MHSMTKSFKVQLIFLEMVTSSFQFMNNPVVLLEALETGTTKFSVKVDDFQGVNFTASEGIRYLKCHGSMCVASNIKKKSIPKP